MFEIKKLELWELEGHLIDIRSRIKKSMPENVSAHYRHRQMEMVRKLKVTEKKILGEIEKRKKK